MEIRYAIRNVTLTTKAAVFCPSTVDPKAPSPQKCPAPPRSRVATRRRSGVGAGGAPTECSRRASHPPHCSRPSAPRGSASCCPRECCPRRGCLGSVSGKRCGRFFSLAALLAHTVRVDCRLHINRFHILGPNRVSFRRISYLLL